MTPAVELWRLWSDPAFEAGADVVRRTAAACRLAGSGPPAVGQTPADVVLTENKLRLLRYRGTGCERSPIPLLLVPSIINRWYVLDLMPGRSLVEFLRDEGFDVWMIDWGTPGPEDRFVTFDDHVERYLRDCVDEVRRVARVPRVSLLGYCIGGVLTTVFTALHGEAVASLANMAAPIDFHDRGLLSAWTRPEYFPVDALVDACGNMPASVLQTSFQWLVPAAKALHGLTLWEKLGDPEKLAYYRALSHWADDNVDVPGETYRKLVRDCYQENRLLRDALEIDGRRVELSAIRCPLLLLTAPDDHICPPESAEALAERVSSTDVTTLRGKGRHIGAFVGAIAQRTLWPRLAAWLAERY